MKRTEKFERHIVLHDHLNNVCGFFYTPTDPLSHRLGLKIIENKNSTAIKYVSEIKIQGLNKYSDSHMIWYGCTLFYEPAGTHISDYIYTTPYTNQSSQEDLSYAYDHQSLDYRETVPNKYFIAFKPFLNGLNIMYQELTFELKDKIKLYPGDSIKLLLHNYHIIGRVYLDNFTYKVQVGQYDIDFAGTVTFKITE